MARRKQLGQILKEMELVKESQIQEALAVQQKKGGAIGRILIRLGYVTEEELSLALGAQVGMEEINLDELETPQVRRVFTVRPAQRTNGFRGNGFRNGRRQSFHRRRRR